MLLNPGIQSSADQYNTSQTGSVHLSCDASPWRQARSRIPGGTEPMEDEEDDTWFPFMNETQVATEECVAGGLAYCAIINFLQRFSEQLLVNLLWTQKNRQN